MGVMAKSTGGGDFTPTPTGIHPALAIDVIDLGEVETPFKDERTGKPKVAHQIQIVWQLHCENEHGETLTRDDGHPFRMSKFYTLSLNEKANLRRDLDSWRGTPFTDEQLESGFDVEVLLHKQCQLNVIERVSKKSGKPTVIVDAVLPKHKLDAKIDLDTTYVREKLKPGGRDTRSPKADPTQSKAPAQSSGFVEDDDDLPF